MSMLAVKAGATFSVISSRRGEDFGKVSDDLQEVVLIPLSRTGERALSRGDGQTKTPAGAGVSLV